jgi:hypothetical protein
VPAELGDPIVVNPEAIALKRGVLDSEQHEAHRGVEHGRIDSVELHIFEPLGGIPAAGGRIFESGFERERSKVWPAAKAPENSQ